MLAHYMFSPSYCGPCKFLISVLYLWPTLREEHIGPGQRLYPGTNLKIDHFVVGHVQFRDNRVAKSLTDWQLLLALRLGLALSQRRNKVKELTGESTACGQYPANLSL